MIARCTLIISTVLGSLLLFCGLAGAAPEISFARVHANLPPALEGQPREAVFRFKNTGDEPLKISKVDVACGCTAPRFTRLTPPGESGEVVLRLDTTGIEGPYKKTARVYANDPLNPRQDLALLGEVKRAFAVDGGRDLVLTGCLGKAKEPITKSVLLRPTGAKLYKLESVENRLAGSVDAKVEPAEEGKAYRLTLAFKGAQARDLNGSVILKLAEGVRVSLWVEGQVQGPVAVRPQRLNFGAIAKDSSLPALLALVVAPGCLKNVKIDNLAYDPKKFQVERLRHRASGTTVLLVGARKGNLPLGRLQEELVIESAGQKYRVQLVGQVL